MHSPVGSPPPAFVLSPRVLVSACVFVMLGTVAVSLAWLHQTVVATPPEGPNARSHIERVLDLEFHHRQILWSQAPGGLPTLQLHELKALIAACRDYERALAELDLTGCPPPFRAAFTRHRLSFKNVRQELSELACSTSEGSLAIHQITAPLASSWASVRDIAQLHGALLSATANGRD